MPRNERRRRGERTATRAYAVDQSRRGAVVLLALKLALVPVVFDPAALVAFSLPKAIVNDALTAGLVVALVMVALRDGARAFRNPVVVTVTVLLLAYAIAAAFALDRYLAVFGSHDRLLGLLSLADMAVTAIALIVLPRPEDIGVLVRAALLGGVVAAAYAVLQLVRLDPVDWKETGRVFGTLGNPTVLGAYLTVLAAGALAIASSREVTTRDRVVLVGLAVAFLATGIASGTRAVVLAFPIVVVFFGLVARRAFVVTRPVAPDGTPSRSRLAILGVAVAALAIVVLTALVFGGRVAAFASDPTRIGDDRSIAGRFAIYEVALAAFREHPLTGAGPDNLEVVFASYRPERYFSVTGVTVPDTSAHSWLASLAVDAGALGIVALVALLVVLVVVSSRHRTASVLVGWALLLAYFAVGIVTVNDVTTLMLFSVGTAAIGRAATVSTREPSRRSGAMAAAPLVAAVLWGVFSVPALSASHSAQTSNAIAQTSASDRAIAAGRDAVTTDDHRAIYWHYLGIAYTRQGKFADARDAFLQASIRAPWNAVYLTNAVRAEVALGQTGDKSALQSSLDGATRAVAIDRNSPDTQFALALALAANGRYEDAITASERGRSLDPLPRDVGVYEVASRSCLRVSKPGDAERWAHDGLRITGVSGKPAVPLRLTLAQALVNLGKMAEAREQLSLVVAVDPNNAEAARIVAQLNAPRP